MIRVSFTVDELVELLPNPYAVDYQCDNAPLDLYTDAEMIKYAHRLISAMNGKLQQNVSFNNPSK